MARRTISEVKIAVLCDERAGVLALARQRCVAIDGLVERGAVDPDFAKEVKRAVRQFADDIAIGLHIEGDDLPGVREAMRPIVLSFAPASQAGSSAPAAIRSQPAGAHSSEPSSTSGEQSR